MSLEINLLPEFGWSIKNQSVYGPGSVFQGNDTMLLQNCEKILETNIVKLPDYRLY